MLHLHATRRSLAVFALALLAACGGSPTSSSSVDEPAVARVVAARSPGSSVTPSAAEIQVGDTVRLLALDAAGEPVAARWTSSDPLVATVTGDGLVTGVKAGATSVTARAGRNSSASAVINVTAPAPAPAPGTDFGAVVRGVRPRGFGATAYVLAQPATGARTYRVSPTGSDAGDGSAAAPFRTIARAAQVAAAGDVVTIAAGSYSESVQVRNAGTAERPIIFQAEQRGSVVLTGGAHNFQPAGWSSGLQEDGAVFVTLRGLIFRDYAPQAADTGHRVRAAVGAIRGWTIEDCLFERAGYNGVDVRGSGVTIVRSTFLQTHTNAITAWAPSPSYIDGLRIVDVILRGNHTRTDPLAAEIAEKVSKLMRTRGALIDNVESFENRGAGFWLDTDNTGYTIRNGYFHHNAEDGLFIEINPAGGKVEGSVFVSNGGPAIKVANSAGVAVAGNLMATNAQCVALVNVDRGTHADGSAKYPLQDVAITSNQCRDWTRYSAVHALGGTFTTPAAMRITANGNTYHAVTAAPLAWWPERGGFLTTLALVQSNLGWEADGRMGAVAVP